MKTESSLVRIFNPENQMLDTTILRVESFTVAAVFAAMEARGWYFTPGVYVALRVEGTQPRESMRLRGAYAPVLTFTVEESERIVTERIAIPA